MRKIFAVLCAIALLAALAVPVVAEGIDLSALSWDELLELREQLNLEMCSRDEWQSVEVPQGVWVVGEDIPAGKWTVTCETGSYGRIAWGVSLDKSGTDIDFFSQPMDSESIYNPEGRLYEEGRLTTYTFEAIEGHYVVISSSSLTFTTYTGKPDLGFK